LKEKIVFICDVCGFENPKWFGQCPQCKNWNTAKEIRQVNRAKIASNDRDEESSFSSLSDTQDVEFQRYTTAFSCFDRVLGGGIVPGSVVLIGGDPGVGKSTLLTQLADKRTRVFYLSGEESKEQIYIRGKRINSDNLDRIQVLNTSHIEKAIHQFKKQIEKKENAVSDSNHTILIVDSIQTMRSEAVNALPGGVVQIRECTSLLVDFAKKENIPVIIVAHITKYGQIAGPKLIEHLVDVVLYFDGDPERDLRIMRSIKNRFGPTNEIGVFEMGESGLNELTDPSERFYDRNSSDSGNAISVIIEGKTPFVVEVQALAVATHFGSPRRLSKGIEQERLNLTAAVLSKRTNLPIENHDLYLNLLGGLRCSDPGIEFPVAVAIFSSFYDIVVPAGTAFFGEIGLDGKIRGVSFYEKRVLELSRLGFTKIYVPKGTLARSADSQYQNPVGVIECLYLKDALDKIFERRR
jgi:DNA repair protein RadA/Sms